MFGTVKFTVFLCLPTYLVFGGQPKLRSVMQEVVVGRFIQ